MHVMLCKCLWLVSGGRLRRDLMREGGVAPLADSAALQIQLGGAEEKFAFARAISRLYEMQTDAYRCMRARA